MKYLFIIVLLTSLTNCSSDKTEPVFEGFVLGERFDIKKIEQKFGEDNTINLHYKRFEAIGIKPRFSFGDYANNIWDYKLANGKGAFVTFVDTDSILTQIIVQVGRLVQMYPSKEGLDDFYHIEEQTNQVDIDFLKNSLKKKYGNPTDSLSMTMDPNLKKIIWQFKKYQVHLLYDSKVFNECKIRYVLDWDKVEKINKDKRDNQLKEQSNNL